MTWCQVRGAVLVVSLVPAVAPAGATGDLEAAAETILIRNVRLIDRTGQTEHRRVSLLIKDAKLDIVTRDEVSLKDGLIGYDAGQGVLLGTLDIGQPAGFVIVDQDPREDMEVLLDTKAHVVFAIRDGTIITNTLPRITAPEPEEEEEPRWIAYTPPPMALPVTYQDTGKWNRWESRPVSGIFLAATALDRQRWLAQDAGSEEQVGDLNEYEGGEIRALRVGFAGTLNFERPWFYQFILVTHAFDQGFDTRATDDVTLLDYRLDIPLESRLGLSVGKQKEPISMERLLVGTQLQMAERPAPVDALFPARNVGISLSGTAFGQRVAWAGGVFNDWFDASQSLDESASQVVGRLSGLAWASAADGDLFHLGLGVRYTDGKEGLRYGGGPEFNQSPVFVDTGVLEAESALTYDLELSWRRGPFWIAGEFLRNEVDSPKLGDPVFSGYHVTVSWALTREMRPYDRRNGTFGSVPVSRSVYQGGAGAWELTARYSSLDLSDGPVVGGEMDILSLGLNWSLTPTFIAQVNYRHVVLDRGGVQGRSDGLLYRVVLILE